MKRFLMLLMIPMFLATTLMSVEVYASGATALAEKNKKRQAKEAAAQLKKGLKSKSGYMALKPEIKTQYQKKGNKVGFLNVAIQLKLASDLSSGFVETHEPVIQSAFVELVASQPPGALRTVKGREVLRSQTKKKFQTMLKELAGVDVIQEVYFTKYLAQ